MNNQWEKAFRDLNQIKYKPSKEVKPLDASIEEMHSKEKGDCGKPKRFCECLQEGAKQK